MTHKDIYTKFMIEYDKANVTSSYPSLTEYEVATVLDKAYHALIAQKVTGNNVRRVALEGDLKSVTDIQPLVIKKSYESDNIVSGFTNDPNDIDNTLSVQIPSDFLYYIGCDIKKQFNTTTPSDTHYGTDGYAGPIDQKYSGSPVRSRRMHVKLVSHQMAENFKTSASNIPWIKNPVCYIEDDTIYIVVDSYDKPQINFCELTYIKTPNKFAKDFINEDINVVKTNVKNFIESHYPEEEVTSGIFSSLTDVIENMTSWSYFIKPHFTYDSSNNDEIKAAQYMLLYVTEMYNFECNDTMAEELISLAVAFALENVESQRLNSKLNMRGLEA